MHNGIAANCDGAWGSPQWDGVSLARRDIIVIGASAGGIEGLQMVVAGLPRDLRAAVFVVVHVPAWHRSELPRVLNYNGGLRALHPAGVLPIEYGKVYVAPPDYHLVLERDSVQLWRGPKENRHRPAVNPLFRSAAVNFGNRVIGVILSGALDDGAAGLWWIKRYGGIAVVQDPEEAPSPEMPKAAMEHAEVDYVVPVSEIGPLLARLTGAGGLEIQARNRSSHEGDEETDRGDMSGLPRSDVGGPTG